MARATFAAAVLLVGLVVVAQAFPAMGIRNLSSTAYAKVNTTVVTGTQEMDPSAAVVAKVVEEAAAVLKTEESPSSESELSHIQRIQMEHSGWGCFGEFNSQDQAWICAGHSVS